MWLMVGKFWIRWSLNFISSWYSSTLWCYGEKQKIRITPKCSILGANCRCLVEVLFFSTPGRRAIKLLAPTAWYGIQPPQGEKKVPGTASNSSGLLVYLLTHSALSYLQSTIKLNNSHVLKQWIREQDVTSLGMLCICYKADIMEEKGRKFNSRCYLVPVLFLFYITTFA